MIVITGLDPVMTGAFCGARSRSGCTLFSDSFSNSRTVIASEAKQSISPHKERMDCFASLAMTVL